MRGDRGRVYRIGELASLAGVTSDTLRYYEREGLLTGPPRTSGGFRMYAEGAVERVAFIKRGQAVGLTLGEIRELITADDRGVARCQRVRDLVRGKLTQVDERLGELRSFRRSLLSAQRRCNRALRTRAGAESPECPVLDRAMPRTARTGLEALKRKRAL